jgi:malonate transporter
LNTALILLPDFLLIVLGWLLSRYTQLDRPIWAALEKLVYWVLFPCMLIASTSRAPIIWAQNTSMLIILGLAMLFVAGITFIGKWILRPDPIKFSSIFQTSFRFNTYIAFAAAGRLAGDEGLAIMAITVAFMVPIANIMAVLSMAKNSKANVWVELSTNPFILATFFGLFLNISGIHLPDLVHITLTRVGSASIPLGLMAVGAGLIWLSSKRDGALVAYLTAMKLMVFPGIVLLMARLAELPNLQLQMAMLFASMPTATSCYVLATRMGGNGAIVSVAITLMTFLAAFTVPFWLLLIS